MAKSSAQRHKGAKSAPKPRRERLFTASVETLVRLRLRARTQKEANEILNDLIAGAGRALILPIAGGCRSGAMIPNRHRELNSVEVSINPALDPIPF